MLNKIIHFLLICFLSSHCSLKSNSSGEKVFYSDRQNPHAKMQLPLEISWTHDRAGNLNQPIAVQVTATALSNLTNVSLKLVLSDGLKLVSGDLSKSISSLQAGSTSEANLTVVPLKAGSYDINILLNANLNGESIGSARTIRFETSDFVEVKSKNTNETGGLHIIEGRTDNGK